MREVALDLGAVLWAASVQLTRVVQGLSRPHRGRMSEGKRRPCGGVNDEIRVVRASPRSAAASAAPQPWTSFNESGPLTGSTLRTASGTALTGGGCQLTPPEINLSPTGPSALTGREDAIDYTTCQYL